jgi:hypothetical protein
MLQKTIITTQGSLLTKIFKKNEIFFLKNDPYNNILWQSKKNNIIKTKKLDDYRKKFLKIK